VIGAVFRAGADATPIRRSGSFSGSQALLRGRRRSGGSPRVLAALVIVAVLALTGCDPAMLGAQPAPASHEPAGEPTSVEPTSAAPTTTSSTTPSAKPTKKPVAKQTQKPVAKKKPTLVAGPALLAPGSQGDRVRDLQARLRQIGWYSGTITGFYGSVTASSVRGFQAKRQIPVNGEVDQRTLDRLYAMTRRPTSDELHNILPKPSVGGLDPRCLTGRVLCISKRTNSLVWVIDGKPQLRVDVRFGAYETPTREGLFSIGWKSRNHVSTIYHTPMPYAMFFSGGQAVHYSADFAARGYTGASHGCVNVRNLSAITWLFDQVQVGDKVVVYR
jgi:peptidoglycan hydrolase-like protein with peptidoglycan-binding domain